jgi:hypothetical protein
MSVFKLRERYVAYIEERITENRKDHLPTVMSSPMKMEPSTTVKTTDNGLNIGGYAGPFLATAHEFRLYFPAVASAPCKPMQVDVMLTSLITLISWRALHFMLNFIITTM